MSKEHLYFEASIIRRLSG